MTELKDTLERIRRQIGTGPDAFEKLSRLRSRRQRRRRVAAGAVAFAVAAAGVWGVARMFSVVEPRTKAGQRPAPPPPDRRILFNGMHSVNADGTDVRFIHRGMQPAWSPDGTQIAYTKTPGSPDHCPCRSLGLFVTNADGTDDRRLTDGNDQFPDWSPDGTRIAFERHVHHQGQVWVVDADGTGLRQVTDLERGAYSPSWSPDGTRILLVDSLGNPYIIDADGSGITPIEADTTMGMFSPQWSPDGTRVVFDAAAGDGWGIYTMGIDGSNVRLLTDFDVGCNRRASWSPDGAWIVFGSELGGCDGSMAALYVMDADGGHLTRILERADATGPSW